MSNAAKEKKFVRTMIKVSHTIKQLKVDPSDYTMIICNLTSKTLGIYINVLPGTNGDIKLFNIGDKYSFDNKPRSFSFRFLPMSRLSRHMKENKEQSMVEFLDDFQGLFELSPGHFTNVETRT